MVIGMIPHANMLFLLKTWMRRENVPIIYWVILSLPTTSLNISLRIKSITLVFYWSLKMKIAGDERRLK